MSDMEIAKHLVMDNQVGEGEYSYVFYMDIVGMAITSVDSPIVDVLADLHDIADFYVPDVELLVVDMAEDLLVSLVADLSLRVADMDFMFDNIVVVGCDQLQRLLVRHYVQFVPESEHANWMVEILVVDKWMQI